MAPSPVKAVPACSALQMRQARISRGCRARSCREPRRPAGRGASAVFRPFCRALPVGFDVTSGALVARWRRPILGDRPLLRLAPRAPGRTSAPAHASKPALTCREGFVAARISTCDARHRRLQSGTRSVTARQKKRPHEEKSEGASIRFDLCRGGNHKAERRVLRWWGTAPQVSEDYADMPECTAAASPKSVVKK